MSDYFNYGFDEFTWASYCLKQTDVRKEVTDSKKQMEDMQAFMTGSMPGMPGAPAAGMPMPPMPGMEGVPPEMQQLFQSMMAQGIDPATADPSQFMMQQGQMNGNQQGFGGGGFGQHGQNQQQMGFGYGAGAAAAGGGNAGGNNRNQGGRGGRRW